VYKKRINHNLSFHRGPCEQHGQNLTPFMQVQDEATRSMLVILLASGWVAFLVHCRVTLADCLVFLMVDQCNVVSSFYSGVTITDREGTYY